MSTITLELPDELAAAVLATPGGLARVRALVEAAFGPVEDGELSAGQRFALAQREEGRSRDEKFRQRTLERRMRKAAAQVAQEKPAA